MISAKYPSSIDMNKAWLSHLYVLLSQGTSYPSRNGQMLELPQQTFFVDMNNCVLDIPERKMSHGFMVAEALWMNEGRDDLESLVKYNKRMAEFSDDGVTLKGAYGPMIMQQMYYVVHTLLKDPDTRQATMSIWRPNPTASKDIPCTVAMSFMLREGKLNMHVYMRSSDAWLGIPYDVFSFSMVCAQVCARYNLARALNANAIMPGRLYITMASSHLYDEHIEKAKAIIAPYHTEPQYRLGEIGVHYEPPAPIYQPRTSLNWTDVVNGNWSKVLDELIIQRGTPIINRKHTQNMNLRVLPFGEFSRESI